MFPAHFFAVEVSHFPQGDYYHKKIAIKASKSGEFDVKIKINNFTLTIFRAPVLETQEFRNDSFLTSNNLILK